MSMPFGQAFDEPTARAPTGLSSAGPRNQRHDRASVAALNAAVPDAAAHTFSGISLALGHWSQPD